MKKVFLSIAAIAMILGGSLTMTSCGGDDDGGTAVTPVTETPVEQALVLSVENTAPTVGDAVNFSVMLGSADVTSECTFKANGTEVSNPFTPTEAGTVSIVASHPDASDSQAVELTVAAGEEPIDFTEVTGTGSFSHNGGDSLNVNHAALILEGFYYANEEQTEVAGWWLQYGFDGDTIEGSQNLIQVTYDVPATLNAAGDGIESYLLPLDGQNAYFSVGLAVINGAPVDGLVTGTGDTAVNTTVASDVNVGVIEYSSFNITNEQVEGSNLATGQFDIVVEGNHNFQFSYEGEMLTNAAPANEGNRTIGSYSKYLELKRNAGIKIVK